MKHACNAISQLASDSLDRPLSFIEKLKFKLHLSMCRKCRDFDHNVKFIKKISALVHDTDYGQIRLSDKQRQLMHERLSQFTD